MAFSELRSMGPRLPPGKLSLPQAVEWVGSRVVAGWDRTEREAAARLDEGVAVATQFEPASEPSLGAGQPVCATCGQPATRIRASEPYCSRHGKRQPIQRKLQELLAKERAAIPAGADNLSELDEEDPQAPDPAALFRWAEAHAALRQKVLGGTLRAALRAPGGKITYPSAEQWRANGFPAPDEARARWEAVPMHVIFDVGEFDRTFGHAPVFDEHPPKMSKEAKPSRRSHHPTRDRARDAMQKDIDNKNETLESIAQMTEQFRADRYGVSRETARLAYGELVGRQSSTSTG
jgi:endogenous inhibitor of DNA gyrase (YacG/DUF329 family)